MFFGSCFNLSVILGGFGVVPGDGFVPGPGLGVFALISRSMASIASSLYPLFIKLFLLVINLPSLTWLLIKLASFTHIRAI